jgi:hypothetical protein
LAVQVLFYGAALLDLWLSDGFVLKRVSAAARSFVVLMAAALCAALVLVRPPEEVWKETQVRSADRAG